MYWYERRYIFLLRPNNFRDIFNCQAVGQHRLLDKLFLMKYNEMEYFQHQCDYVRVKCEKQM